MTTRAVSPEHISQTFTFHRITAYVNVGPHRTPLSTRSRVPLCQSPNTKNHGMKGFVLTYDSRLQQTSFLLFQHHCMVILVSRRRAKDSLLEAVGNFVLVVQRQTARCWVDYLRFRPRQQTLSCRLRNINSRHLPAFDSCI